MAISRSTRSAATATSPPPVGGGFFSGNATFQTGGTIGDLLIHDAQFAGQPTGQTITIPHGTTAVVENDVATWNNTFNFNDSGELLIDSQQISTTQPPATAPVITMGSSALLDHTGANIDPTVQPVLHSSGTIEDAGGGLSFANPNGTTQDQVDTLSGTLIVAGTGGNEISLGDTGTSDSTKFQLTGPLTADITPTVRTRRPRLA